MASCHPEQEQGVAKVIKRGVEEAASRRGGGDPPRDQQSGDRLRTAKLGGEAFGDSMIYGVQDPSGMGGGIWHTLQSRHAAPRTAYFLLHPRLVVAFAIVHNDSAELGHRFEQLLKALVPLRRGLEEEHDALVREA